MTHRLAYLCHQCLLGMKLAQNESSKRVSGEGILCSVLNMLYLNRRFINVYTMAAIAVALYNAVV